MKTMMRSAAAAVAVAFLLAACGGSPTAATKAGTAGPSYDGGFTMGSGNREAPADTTLDAASTPGSESTERGGFTMGSGN